MKTQSINTNPYQPQITTSRTIKEVDPSEKYIVEPMFKNLVKNIKKFNGKRLTYKSTTVGNGKTFEMFKDNVLITKIYLLCDRNGWTLSVTDFK